MLEIARRRIAGVWRTGYEEENGGSQPYKRAEFTFEDLLGWDGEAAASATISTGGEGFMTFTAVTPGIGGNAIAILSDVTPDTTDLSITVDGTTITLHLEADSMGNVVSTFGNVQDAFLDSGDPSYNAAAAALVTVSDDPVGTNPYEVGDTYLQDGSSFLLLDTLAAGSVVMDAQWWFAEAWDATADFRVRLGEQEIYYEGPPDATKQDDPYTPVAIPQENTAFTTLYRSRAVEDSPLAIYATSEQGAAPSQGAAVLVVEVAAP